LIAVTFTKLFNKTPCKNDCKKNNKKPSVLGGRFSF
jgi:hypothetical protein